MIYRISKVDEPLDQGDLFDDCPVATVTDHSPDRLDQAKVALDMQRVIVLTQTCDFANAKVDLAVVASVFDAQQMVDLGVLKAADVKGAIRASRVWGLYFLPAHAEAGLGEMIVDLRRLHSVRPDVLGRLRVAGKRRAQLMSPYREHLAKHFADTYSRIGLPQPYETT
jgi:hypothetical protein